jgi:RHS repeat-associated protein
MATPLVGSDASWIRLLVTLLSVLMAFACAGEPEAIDDELGKAELPFSEKHTRVELSPILECVERLDRSHFVAVFGYRNASRDASRRTAVERHHEPSKRDGAVHIPVGRRNQFLPRPTDRHQPTEFAFGRIRNVARVPFDGNELTWQLNGQEATADRHSPECENDIELSSVTPDSGGVGETLVVTISGNGTHFDRRRTTVSFGDGVSVGGAATGAYGPVSVTSATSLQASIDIRRRAVAGPRTVSVQTGDDTVSLRAGFSVLAPNRPPVAAIAGPTLGVSGEVLVFDAAGSSDPDGDALSIAWNFGDGTSASDPTVTHAYSAPGRFPINLTVTDGRGGTDTESLVVTVVQPNRPPTANAGTAASGTVGTPFVFDGTATIDPDGDELSFSWDFGDGTSGAGATASHAYDSAGTFTVTLTVDDGRGGVHSATTTATARDVVGPTLPPDPATVASPLSLTVATSLQSATEFLYTREPPIQTGVAPGTIELRRAAVLRGRAADRGGEPLSGVKISVLDHPEFGQTLTRDDGAFDLAVNGGGLLTVRYERSDLLQVQRQLDVPWGDYSWLPDVVMIPLDSSVTEVDFALPRMQVARGSRVADEAGERQATVLIPSGTGIETVLPDGSVDPQVLTHIRATEFTVGASGPSAMPADLPPSSAYTYAVELTTDEALARGAIEVRFSQPLTMYVENFLGFPVGTAVPTGYYDRQKGEWVASKNGRVVQILGFEGASETDDPIRMAVLDIDGNGQAASAEALQMLGVTLDERLQVAKLYQPGQSFWRVPVAHFTPWDCNWPYGPPEDAVAPPGKPKNKPKVKNPDKKCGSIIGCEDQSLGESISIVGTPWRLHYQSKRTRGRRDAYTVEVPVTGDEVPASLRLARAFVRIAGRDYRAEFAPSPNLSYTVLWDGTDVYGRVVQGEQTATIDVTYEFEVQYYPVQTDFEQSFARAAPLNGDVAGIRTPRARFVVHSKWTDNVGQWDVQGFGFGGWSLGIHHAYDPSSGTVLFGDDGRRSDGLLSSVVTTVAGTGQAGRSADGGPALSTALDTRYSSPSGSFLSPRDLLAVGPDASLYVAEPGIGRVRRVAPDGTVHTVAGNGHSNGPPGDGGPALDATLSPTALAVGPDGSLFIADHRRATVRRVTPDGLITTVAGDGSFGISGDGGHATAAGLCRPSAIDVGADGSVYIADHDAPNVNTGGFGCCRVRRVSTDGIINTVAGRTCYGSTNLPSGGDGDAATANDFSSPVAIAAARDGSLLIADGTFGVADLIPPLRRVAVDGIIDTVGGFGPFVSTFSGDGGPAKDAYFRSAESSLAVAGDGGLFASEAGGPIRYIGQDGILVPVLGGRLGLSLAENIPAVAAGVRSNIQGLAAAPDGGLYFLESERIRRINRLMPSLSISEILFPSEDGRELYVFSTAGQHLRTLDGLTGALRYSFEYVAGYLRAVTDAVGNTTTIERAGSVPTAIVAPGGQRTVLSVDANGWLSHVSNPAGETHVMSTSPSGLLRSFSDPLGNAHSFSYDDQGLLTRDSNPAGGSTTLRRTQIANGFSVTTTSALGRLEQYVVEELPNGAIRQTQVGPSGAATMEVLNADGSRQVDLADGSTATMTFGPDPRWGMLSPVSSNVTVRSPSGLTHTTTTSRVASYDPRNPLSLTTLTDTVTVNGLSSTRTYDGPARTLTFTTASGRKAAISLDSLGRPVQGAIAGLAANSTSYDHDGLIDVLSVGSGSTTRSTLLVYDGARQLAAITDPEGRTTAFDYDLVGRPIENVFPDGSVVAASYDLSGNTTSITPPGRPAHEFDYTPIDQVASYRPPDIGIGDTSTAFAYDADRELRTVTLPDGQRIDLGYDVGGRPSTLDFSRGRISYTYDPTRFNLTRISSPDGVGLGYHYDGPLVTQVVWTGPVSGTVEYAYDNNLRVTTQRINGTQPVTFSYDADGLLTAAGALTLVRDPQSGLVTGTALAGIAERTTYNEFGELNAYSATYSNREFFSVTYDRDTLGRITTKNEAISGATSTYEYGYDLGGRLSEVHVNGSLVATYDYDGNNNRLHAFASGELVSGTYDNQDRLLTYGDAVYQFGANGELQTKATGLDVTTYDYDPLGNLSLVTFSDGTTIEYVVDGLNRRVGKRLNGTLVSSFLYDGGLRPIVELNGSGGIVSRFVYCTRSNVPDYMTQGRSTYRFVLDDLGSVRLVVDTTTGIIAQRLEYNEFGVVQSDSRPGFQPFGFAGGLYDADTALVRFGARDYDATTGRWTAKDPIRFAGGQSNLYTYVGNDPINRLDQTGLMNPSGGINGAAVCPNEMPEADACEANGPTWERDSLAGEFLFHGGNTCYREYRPTESSRTTAQCCYDSSGSLLPEGLRASGSADNYDPKRQAWKHTVEDEGGIWQWMKESVVPWLPPWLPKQTWPIVAPLPH